MIKAALMVLVAFLAGPQGGAEAVGHDFLAGFPDVVMAPGFEEDPSQRVVFDTCEGLIVETVLLGSGPAGRVLAFYDESLAQLGWSRVESGPVNRVYIREDDRLELTAEAGEDGLTLRLFLQPVEPG